MIWFCGCNRDELLRVLGGGYPSAHLVESAAGVSMGGNEFGLLWRSRKEPPIGPPHAIVARSVRDFIAWSSTYLASYRPITAYFRIVRQDDLKNFAADADEIGIGRYANAVAGTMLAETYLEAARLGEAWHPSVPGLLSTASFVLARAFALQAVATPREIIDRWARVARHVTVEDREDIRRALASVWGSLLGGDTSAAMTLITSACRQLLAHGQVDQDVLARLAESADVAFATQVMTLSRERRLEWLDNVMRRLNVNRSIAVQFVVGYLFSQLAPGSLEHIDLLAEAVVPHPAIVLWYGMCAGLHPRSEVQNYGAGIARRALRDVEAWEQLVDRPRSDFGIDELDLLLPSDAFAILRRPFTVEIAPRVYTTLGGALQRSTSVVEAVDHERLEALSRLLNNATDMVYELRHPGDRRQIDFRRSKAGQKAPPKAR